MDTENKKNESSKNQMAGKSGSEVYGHNTDKNESSKAGKSDSDIAAAQSAAEFSSEVYGRNMDVENKKNETPKQQTAGKPGSDSSNAQIAMKRGAEVIGQAEHAVSNAYDKTSHAVSDAYDKTAHAVSETYENAKSYGSENPGKIMLIALGIGVGLWIIMGESSRRSRTGRLARPVVNAISDIALEFFH